MFVVVFVMLCRRDKTRTDVIQFEGSPLEVLVKNNQPVLTEFEVEMRAPIKKAWSKHQDDLFRMYFYEQNKEREEKLREKRELSYKQLEMLAAFRRDQRI